MNKRRYAFLILSCDKNKELLKLFLSLFYQFVPHDVRIYVMMENDSILDNGVVSINTANASSWSERLITAISQIAEEQIVLMCDDHIIESKIKINEIDELSELLCNNKKIGNVLLTEIQGKSIEANTILKNYVLRAKYGRYRTALQVGIWNKQFLLDVTVPGETPWEFEIFSNMRSFPLQYECYALNDNNKKPIEYNDGFFIIRGKINSDERKRLETKLCKSFSIDGFSEWGDKYERDAVNFLFRIIRRFRIIIYYILKRIQVYIN